MLATFLAIALAAPAASSERQTTQVYEAALQEAFRITEEMPNVHDRAKVVCIALPAGDPSTEMLQRLATKASFPLVAFSNCEREGLLAPALGLGSEPVNLLRIFSVKWLSKATPK